jgi:serine O-acetyltransferase
MSVPPMDSTSPGLDATQDAPARIGRMRFAEYRYLLLSDLYRITGSPRRAPLLRYMFWGESYRYNFWLRTCSYTRGHPLLRP